MATERDPEVELERVLDGIVESLDEATEEELDDELVAAGEDPETAAGRVRELGLAALRRHRRGRMTRARERYRERRREIESHEVELPATPEERLELLVAAIEARPQLEGMLTLHHRDYRSLPDEDVTSCLRQLIALGALDAP